MSEVLDGIRMKIDFARRHARELDALCEEWAQTNTEPVIKIDRDRDWEVVTAAPPTPPAEISVLLGELVHDLRSSLDHLVSELVRSLGYQPGGHNYFPITFDQADFNLRTTDRKNRKGDLRKGALNPIPTSHAIFKIIRDHQPYKRWDLNNPGGPAAEYLAIVQRMWNIDKHRRLIRAGLTLTDSQQELLDTFYWHPDAVLVEQKVNQAVLGSALEKEVELLRVRFADPAYNYTHVKSTIPADIMLYCSDGHSPHVRMGTRVPFGLVNRVESVFKDLQGFII